MKSVQVSALFVSLVAAHSAVWDITFDGTKYPARDARFDEQLGAKRIEWSFKNELGRPWQAITDVLNSSIACGADAKPPALKAKARAGSEVVVHWSGMIRMHNGPVMSYLAPFVEDATKAKFFKISGEGYDKVAKKWANEKVLEQNTTDYVQLPSDIKPGMYIFRTELLALHGNAINSQPVNGGGPQFYTHCFNVEISGSGNVVPDGVVFPGAYGRNDPGVGYNLYKNKAAWADYIVPGPSRYMGKYEKPTGEPPKVTAQETGVFPPEFQSKYEAYKAKQDKYAREMNDMVNGIKPADRPNVGMMEFLLQHNKDSTALEAELKTLRAEAVKLGIATA